MSKKESLKKKDLVQESTKKPVKDTLKQYLTALEKTYGNGIVVKADVILDATKIPTDILLIDILLEGGFPTGTINLLYGVPSSGKSLASIALARTFTKRQQFVTLIDIEKSYNRKWWEANGVDIKYLYIAQPDELEKAIDIADTLVASKKMGLVIFDSLTSGIPKEVADNSAYKDQIALQARRNAKLMSKVLGRLQPSDLTNPETYNNTIFLGITHLREKVGFVMGNPRIMPGGWSPKHSAHNILLFSKGPMILKKEEPVGHEIRIKVEKSKCSTPYVSGVTEFFNKPPHFNNAKVLVIYAIKYGIIQQAGAWYTYKDCKAQGADKLLEQVTEKKLLGELKELVITNANK